MSRIYEALQKAEAERDPKAASFASERGTTGLLRALALGSEDGVEAPTRRSARDARTALLDEPTPFPEGWSTPAHEHSEIELNAIPQTVWHPAFDRLPSLLERGPAVEQFRSLRARLYELRDKRQLKTLLVSSGLPQEGKSFVSSNLAVSLARNKHARVLLIDGDMRRYTVHHTMGCKAEPGLADFLGGRATIPEILQRVDPAKSSGMVQGNVVQLPALTVIPGGNGGDNAADLSSNGRWAELLRVLTPSFDWIVVDSSPVLPVSDTVNLSRNCDGVLLVARSGVTEYANLQRTQAELKSANLIGVVLNGTSASTNRESYYGYESQPAPKGTEPEKRESRSDR